MGWRKRTTVGALAAAMILGGCQGGGGAGKEPIPDPPNPVEPGELPLPSGAETFFAAFTDTLAASSQMTPAEFVALYTPADAPTAAPLSYDPTASTYFAEIDAALKLTAAEKARIKDVGFMVSERLEHPTFAEALLKVYELDLPVLVTTDMLLQALHASYDDILMGLEESVLTGLLTEVLRDTHEALGAMTVGDDAMAKEALADMDFYLAMARSLLTGQQVGGLTGGDVDARVTAFLDHVASRAMREVVVFGAERVMDFSQFEPRGHYEGYPDLERYFQAMMWLGRVDLRFMEQVEGAWQLRLRQVAGAFLLERALKTAAAEAGWRQIDDILTMMVGEADYVAFPQLAELIGDFGFDAVGDVTGLAAGDQSKLAGALLSGTYGQQRINSHWLETNPHSAEVTPLPASFAFLGQRFVVDSHVMANVVYDTIVYQGQKVQRVLPNPLDVLFALGSDQVVEHLAPELEAFPYQGNLHNLRFLVDYYDQDFWSSNLYNLWLSALRTLNAPTTSTAFPEPMRSPAWRDRVLQTQLGSWAQLRHDTLLYAKQSYTGGVSCEHPDGYVEPYPAFYAALEQLARVAGHTLANVDFPADASWMRQRLTTFFDNWASIMVKLRVMADKELAGEPFTEDEIAFLKTTIQSQMGCGDPVFSGWYPSLYWGGSEEVDEWAPTIADVHTNPNQGPLPGPNVLHVATGNVNLMVLTAETCEGPEAYVGPVFSYYELDPGKIERWADSDWEDMLSTGDVPARPTWTQSFVVPAP